MDQHLRQERSTWISLLTFLPKSSSATLAVLVISPWASVIINVTIFFFKKEKTSPVPIWTDAIHLFIYLPAEFGCCQEISAPHWFAQYKTATIELSGQILRSQTHQNQGCMCCQRLLFFPPSPPPSLPPAAAEKRKFKDLGMCIFPAPHAYFLGNEVLPTLRNSSSYLQLPLGAVRVQCSPALL